MHESLLSRYEHDLGSFEGGTWGWLGPVVLLLLLSPTRAAAARGEAPLEVRPLELGTTLERGLGPGEEHRYSLDFGADELVRVSLEESGIHLVATLTGPGGELLLEAHPQYAEVGRQLLSWIATIPVSLELTVRRSGSGRGAGGYRLALLEQRPAEPRDRSIMELERETEQAERLFDAGTGDSLAQAFRILDALLIRWRELGSEMGEAETLYRQGLILQDLGEAERALALLRRAAEHFARLGDRLGRAKTLARIALALDRVGEHEEALDAYRQASRIARELGVPLIRAEVENGIGIVWYSLGKYQEAIDALGRAHGLWQQLGHMRDRETEALFNRAAIHQRLGDLPRASQGFRRALAGFRELGNAYGEASAHDKLAQCLLDLDRGDPGPHQAAEARDHLEKALEIRRRIDDRRGLAATAHNLGVERAKAGNPEAALALLNEALDGRRAIGDRTGQAHTLAELARLHADLGRHRRALELGSHALELWRALGDPYGHSRARYGMAESLRALGRELEALAHLEAATELAELSRTQPAAEHLRSTFFASKQEMFEEQIDLLFALHRGAPEAGYDRRAFEVSERARARSLLDRLGFGQAEVRQGVDPELVRREEELVVRIASATAVQVRAFGSLDADADPVPEASNLEDLLEELRRIRGRIYAGSPRLAALVASTPADFETVTRRLLAPGELLLQFHLGEARSFLWAVSGDGLVMAELPARKTIAEAVAAARENLASSHLRLRRRAAQRMAADLGRMLLRPAEGEIRRARTLLFAAHGALHGLPFPALELPSASGTEGNPLVESHRIAHLFSASAVLAQRRLELELQPSSEGEAIRGLAVFADPVFHAEDPRVGGAGQPSAAPAEASGAVDPEARPAVETALRALGGGRLARLPFSRLEAERIRRFVGAERVLEALGFEATPERVLHGDLSRYRLLHFATHALLHDRHPELSGLVLSMVDEHGRPRDGFLGLHQIRGLELNAELVVLSTCSSALGRAVDGEGLIGLPRGLLRAGARSVVASLWDVGDRATAELMGRFYRGLLREGLPPIEALRRAQLSMARDERWAAPAHWAAFVLQGDWRTPPPAEGPAAKTP